MASSLRPGQTVGYSIRGIRTHFSGYLPAGLLNVNAYYHALLARIGETDVNSGIQVETDNVFVAASDLVCGPDDTHINIRAGDIIAVNPDCHPPGTIRSRVVTVLDQPGDYLHRQGERVTPLFVHITTPGGAGEYRPLARFDRLPDAQPDADGAYPDLAVYERDDSRSRPIYNRVFDDAGRIVLPLKIDSLGNARAKPRKAKPATMPGKASGIAADGTLPDKATLDRLRDAERGREALRAILGD